VTPGPVIAPDGTIVAASTAGVLHGLDPATGLDRWAFDAQGGYGIDLSTSPAVLPDGTVLWPGPHNTLYALDGRGQLLWKEPLRGQPSSPAVVGDRVVVGDSQGGVTAFEVRAGGHRRLWSVDVGDVSYGSVALSPTDPHRTYQSVDDRLVALDDGRVRWRARLAEVTEVSPAVGPDGTVVVGDNSPDEYGFSPAGKRLWSYRHGGQTYSSPVVTADGTAWFGDHRAYVTGVDARTGRVRGRFRGEGVEPPHGPSVGVWTSPVIDAAHNTYWGTRLGHVYGRAPSGEVLFDLSTGATVDSYPALTGDGALVVGVTDGRLLAIGP
jgi:outer membrane protein assembly factor BamB